MFIGHYALALTAKRDKTLPSLAMMFVAVQFLDLLWPIFVLLGIESFEIDPGNTAITPLNFTYYPYSHSLFMSFVWAVLFGIIYLGFTKNKRGSILLGALVMSHWGLDLLTHRADLPLSPFGDIKLGLGLWNMPYLETLLEVGMFSFGSLIYYKSIKPVRKKAFWSLIILFIVIHFMNILGPPPPSINAVAWSANLMWLFVLWAWWIEKKKINE